LIANREYNALARLFAIENFVHPGDRLPIAILIVVLANFIFKFETKIKNRQLDGR
jgi:hypothetical protein